MRIRVLILIVLTAGWLLPAGGLACRSDSAADGGHPHVARQDGHPHAHGLSDHDPAEHSHAQATSDSRPSAPSAPSDDPICCTSDANASVAIGSIRDARPRSKAAPVALSNLLPKVPQPVALPTGARLRLRQPPPLPYARTRRPLLI